MCHSCFIVPDLKPQPQVRGIPQEKGMPSIKHTFITCYHVCGDDIEYREVGAMVEQDIHLVPGVVTRKYCKVCKHYIE